MPSPERPDRPRQRLPVPSLTRATCDCRPRFPACWPPGPTPRTCAFGPLAQPPVVCGIVRTSLRAWLRDACQQCANLCLPIPAVTAKRTDGCELASLRPPRNGLGVDPEHRGDLRRREQGLSLGCACRHMYGLSSWTGTPDPGL